LACFLVPMVLAIITTIIQKASGRLATRLKLTFLNTLLWGGVMLLAVEHVWHGEVVPWPPFLTAMANPINIPVMLYEMATIGTTMSVVIVLTWTITLTLIRVMPKIVTFKELEQVKKPLTQL